MPSVQITSKVLPKPKVELVKKTEDKKEEKQEFKTG